MEKSIIDEIVAEVARQSAIGNAQEDRGRSWSEWAAIVTGYVGRAVPAMYRNTNEGLVPRDMMIKAAATIISAITARDAV